MTDKLIIVCEDGEKKYATYLRQLVSARDDEENKQVGTKDGGVEAVIWNGKQYQDNLVKLTSLNHVLFIGDTNLGKTVRANVKDVCYEPGMHCGMLGTQSYMYVENNSMNKDNYKDFCALCEKYGKRFEKKLDLRYSPSEKTSIPDVGSELSRVGLEALSPVADAAANLAGGAFQRGKQVVDFAGDMFKADLAKDQQYNLLTLIVYMDVLPKFFKV